MQLISIIQTILNQMSSWWWKIDFFSWVVRNPIMWFSVSWKKQKKTYCIYIYIYIQSWIKIRNINWCGLINFTRMFQILQRKWSTEWDLNRLFLNCDISLSIRSYWATNSIVQLNPMCQCNFIPLIWQWL